MNFHVDLGEGKPSRPYRAQDEEYVRLLAAAEAQKKEAEKAPVEKWDSCKGVVVFSCGYRGWKIRVM